MREFETHRNCQAWRRLGIATCILAVLPAGCRKSGPELRVQEYRDRLEASMGQDHGKPMMLPVYPGGPAHYTLEEKTIDDTLTSIEAACGKSPFPDVTHELITSEDQRPEHVFSLHDPASNADHIYNANDASLLVIELREQYQTIRQPEDKMTCLHDFTDYLDQLTQASVPAPPADENRSSRPVR